MSAYYKGKRMVVTGAASGMGQATARKLAALGAEVFSLDIREAADGRYIPVDMTDRASIDRAFAAVEGPVHGLFSCAGLPHGPGMDPLKVFTVNFIGLRYLTERFLETAPRGGAAVTVSSVGGMGWASSLPLLKALMDTDWDGAVAFAKAHPDYVSPKTCYTASKQAATYYTMYKCREFTARGLRLNTVSPGPTTTGMTPVFNAANSEAYMTAMREALGGRDATSEDQANAMIFLNDGDLASYVNGANLYVDAGMASRIQVGQWDIIRSANA